MNSRTLVLLISILTCTYTTTHATGTTKPARADTTYSSTPAGTLGSQTADSTRRSTLKTVAKAAAPVVIGVLETATGANPIIGIASQVVKGATMGQQASQLGKQAAEAYKTYAPPRVQQQATSQIDELKTQLAGGSYYRQTKRLPAQDLNKWHIPGGNYSGITPLGGDSFAIVDDKSPRGGFYILHLQIDSVTGEVISARRSDFIGPSEGRPEDNEDIVFVPSRQTLFLTSENASTVEEYTLDGQKTGRRLHIPSQFGIANLQDNSGLEALAYDDSTGRFWTTSECRLKSDSRVWDGHDSVQAMRIQAFDSTLAAAEQYPYLLSAPQLRTDGLYYTHGIPAMTYLGDGQMLIMERELAVPRGYFGAKTCIRIFVTQLDSIRAITGDTRLETLPRQAFLNRHEVARFTTGINLTRINFGNFEGMCLGPKLQDGHQTILLLSDSQNNAGNSLARLKDYIKVIVL